ncbi:MAG: hypothetical protein EON48_12830, partial [Acetobacteraceae bacterium]
MTGFSAYRPAGCARKVDSRQIIFLMSFAGSLRGVAMSSLRAKSIAACAAAIYFGIIGHQALARDLVYQPVSPAFGGSPLNGSFVLGLAQANNSRYLESPQAKKDRRENAARNAANSASDPALQFQRQITASLLSQIAGQVSQQIIGENARDSGTFSFGGTQIQFARANGQINIDITE